MEKHRIVNPVARLEIDVHSELLDLLNVNPTGFPALVCHPGAQIASIFASNPNDVRGQFLQTSAWFYFLYVFQNDIAGDLLDLTLSTMKLTSSSCFPGVT